MIPLEANSWIREVEETQKETLLRKLNFTFKFSPTTLRADTPFFRQFLRIKFSFFRTRNKLLAFSFCISPRLPPLPLPFFLSVSLFLILSFTISLVPLHSSATSFLSYSFLHLLLSFLCFLFQLPFSLILSSISFSLFVPL